MKAKPLFIYRLDIPNPFCLQLHYRLHRNKKNLFFSLVFSFKGHWEKRSHPSTGLKQVLTEVSRSIDNILLWRQASNR